MKHSTLTCVDQHLGFTVLIVYSPSKGLGRDIYFKNVAWMDPPSSNLLQVIDQLSKTLNLNLKGRIELITQSLHFSCLFLQLELAELLIFPLIHLWQSPGYLHSDLLWLG